MLRIRAARVHPVTAPPIEDGAVLIDDNGRIAAVGANADVVTPHAARAMHYPDADLLPGLIDCHTHLELTHLGGGGRHDEPEFVDWIRRIRSLKEATSAEAFYEAALAGVRDCWRRGVTCIADTGSSGAVMQALHDLGGRGIVYQEVFGPDPAQASASMVELRTAVLRLRDLTTAQLLVGVSPHAPYTVSAELYNAVGTFSRREGLPIAVHVAESPEETALVLEAGGPFAEALRERGITLVPRGCSPVAYLLKQGVIKPGTLCIHCVHVDEADIELLRATGATVAHCPRSNSAHRHGLMPLLAMRRAGVAVGLGSDSVVSVGELDLWAEARAAGINGADAIRVLTIEGARALSWDSEIGSLDVGKAADLALFSLAAPRRPSPPLAALTVVSGRIVHQISAP